MQEPLPREISFLARFCALHQRVFWRSIRKLPPFSGDLVPPLILVDWITRHIEKDSKDFEFQLAVCHLRFLGCFDPDWLTSSESVVMLRLLTSPSVANRPELEWFWRSGHMSPLSKLVDAILTQAATDGASEIEIVFGQPTTIVNFKIDGVVREAMTIPSTLNYPLDAQLRFAIGSGWPGLIPMAALALHEMGLRPEPGDREEQRVLVKFVEDSEWLSRFGLTPQKIREVFRI